MPSDKLRRRIAFEAAQLMYDRDESEYARAKRKAARRIVGENVKPGDLPSDGEVRDEIRLLARLCEENHATEPQRVTALRVKRLFEGRYPRMPLAEAAFAADRRIDRFELYRLLLLPLEQVRENPERHPESDALYHSLQVFDLAWRARPHDEEFLLAALLHDVGKAIDRREPTAAGLEALANQITERTAWLIEHHAEAHRLLDGTLGVRARRRLAAHEDYDELVLLAECDRNGRTPGVETPDVDAALDYLRALAQLEEE